jgi:hypothetical protein
MHPSYFFHHFCAHTAFALRFFVVILIHPCVLPACATMCDCTFMHPRSGDDAAVFGNGVHVRSGTSLWWCGGFSDRDNMLEEGIAAGPAVVSAVAAWADVTRMDAWMGGLDGGNSQLCLQQTRRWVGNMPVTRGNNNDGVS